MQWYLYEDLLVGLGLPAFRKWVKGHARRIFLKHLIGMVWRDEHVQ